MTGVVAYLALVVATAALLCGHHGTTPPRPQRGARRGLWAPHRVSRGSRATTGPHSPADGRVRPQPLWARSQPLTYEEA
ncbi:hypothetical protein SUDANB1_00431 [Streptomyces sp. enrichment culture]